MVHPVAGRMELPGSATALAFGPGLAAASLSKALKDQLPELWRTLPMPVLADASALDWLPAGRARTRALRVVTPHPGEAGRLLGVDAREVQSDRPGALRAISKRLGGAWVVLKGRHTLVGRATGPLYANGSGDAGLAQGGTGDLLAGLLAGLLAQPQLAGDPLTLLRYGVWRHGAAADRLTGRGAEWTVETLAAEL
jgi:NAD(P)H-hydrate epimerase